MKPPINCTSDHISDFLNEDEANELYTTLINNYQLDKSRIIMQAGGKPITTGSFKILFATESLIKQNSHPEEVHGKCFKHPGPMAV